MKREKTSLEIIKEHRKDYPASYGCYYCSVEDFDWLIEQAELAEKLQKELQKIKSRPTNSCMGCGEPIDHYYCDRCRRQWES